MDRVRISEEIKSYGEDISEIVSDGTNFPQAKTWLGYHWMLGHIARGLYAKGYRKTEKGCIVESGNGGTFMVEKGEDSE